MKTIISAKTTAETSDPFEINYSNAVCTLVADGLAESEEIEIEIESMPDQYTAAYDPVEETKYVLKSTANVIAILTPGRYRLVKPVTAGDVSVGMHTMD